MEEFVTFYTTTSTGEEVEMAVVDEFEYDGKNYVAASLIKEDEIDDSNVFIFRVEVSEDDFRAIKITNKFEYNAVCKAYMEMNE